MGGRGCEPCPYGASCGGGDERPFALSGFWSSDEELLRATNDGGERLAIFWRCANGEVSCPGGVIHLNATATCAADRAGPRCASCAHGWMAVGVLCAPCGSLPWLPPLLTFLLVAWPHAAVWTFTHSGSARQLLRALQALALIGTLSLSWPSGPAGFRIAEILGGVRLFLQDPAISHFSCGTTARLGSSTWSLIQMLPLLEAAALACMQFFVYLVLRCIVHLSREELHLRMAKRIRRTLGYWARVLSLQWPGLLYRCMQRIRCEADPAASAYSSSPTVVSGGSTRIVAPPPAYPPQPPLVPAPQHPPPPPSPPPGIILPL